MKKSVKMQIKSDFMGTLEYNYRDKKYSSPIEYAENEKYRFDIDEYNNDETTRNAIDAEYAEYIEKTEYRNFLIEKLCDYLEKI